MGNLIRNNSNGENGYLKMSNGGTSILINAFALSGSHLAKEEHEIEFMSWIVSRDQGVLGMGTVSFDLQDMPWSENESVFNQQKSFVLKVIQRVKTEQDLSVLEYNTELLRKNIEAFEQMVSSFQFENVDSSNSLIWMPAKRKNVKCKTHSVFLHEHGCVVCNDK